MVKSQLMDQADAVKKEIALDLRQGADELIKFVNRFAIDGETRHEALILKLDLNDPRSNASEADVRRQMHALCDQVSEAFGAADDAQRATIETRSALESSPRPTKERPIAFKSVGLGLQFGAKGFHLRGVDLELRLGEITAVVGQNANGKTTLFRLIIGEFAPSEGSISYPALSVGSSGNAPWWLIKRQIGYVPQALGKWYGSLRNNLYYAAAIHGLRGKENQREVEYIIERLDLADHIEKQWSELSSGYQLRFELARTLVWRPKLVVLDEPLANLDFKAQLTVLRDICDLANSHRDPIAVAVSSQHLHEIEAIADNILFLANGEVVFNGPSHAIGEARTENVFEIRTQLDTSVLRERLDLPGIKRIYFDGISSVIVTSLDVRPDRLLAAFVERGIEIEYFRDISGSVKQLFERESKARRPKQ